MRHHPLILVLIEQGVLRDTYLPSNDKLVLFKLISNAEFLARYSQSHLLECHCASSHHKLIHQLQMSKVPSPLQYMFWKKMCKTHVYSLAGNNVLKIFSVWLLSGNIWPLTCYKCFHPQLPLPHGSGFTFSQRRKGSSLDSNGVVEIRFCIFTLCSN